MLTDHHADAMLLSRDLDVAKEFYTGTLGLPLLYDEGMFVAFGAGHDSRIVVTRSTVGSRDEATKASFRVSDVHAEIADLRARGVVVRDYPELGTVDGVLELDFGRVAWFDDPDGNSLQLTQFTAAPASSGR